MIIKLNIALNAKTEHIIPVQLPKNKLNEVMDLSLKLTRLLAVRELPDQILNFIKISFIY
jgi:hypothetical protein